MPTQSSQTEMDFGSSGGRKLVGAFDGGAITSNGGVVLLASADKRIGLCDRLAACFTDHRSGSNIEHDLGNLLRQRIFGQALGHEDLIGHDTLRFDRKRRADPTFQSPTCSCIVTVFEAGSI